MPELSSAQRELAALHGVAVDYVDWWGHTVAVPGETVLAVLASLDVHADTHASAEAELERFRRRKRLQALPPCVVTRQGRESEIVLRHGAGARARAWVELEGGGRVEVDVWPNAPDRPVAAGLEAHESKLLLPATLPLGYHRLHAGWRDGAASTALVITPDFLGLPDRLGTDRAWGLATQLYSVRSRTSWGIGDIGDLRRLATWSGSSLGADYLLVNPLSAAEPVGRMEPSPYLPSSRAFVNPVYIRVADIAEYGHLPPDDRAEIEALERGVHQALDDLDLIDRDTCWAAKSTALRLIHAVPRSGQRELAYRTFLDQGAEALRDFATWCALSESFGPDWHEWPDELAHPEGEPVSTFRAEHAADVDFYRWLQWVLDEQLAATQSAALDSGMRLGVMHDLAVGVHPCGADSWMLQDVLARGITVGAPPDAFTQLGQDWSQPPWRPDRLEALGYAPYRRLISSLLRHAGALRVDHIIGLFRLWCIPEGSTADRGTYLHFDHEALIGILALEGHRAGAVIVGEDLGNVAASTRSYLVERGIIGTSILWFEQDAAGGPLPAERWREYCLASLTTHDLPPTAGYLAGSHVELRGRLGLLTRPLEAERAIDEATRAGWLALLSEQGMLGPHPSTEETVAALHCFLARTPSRLIGVALGDAVGDRRTQNQPGTTDEYPNWRVPLAGPDGERMYLEDVITSRRAGRLAATVRRCLERP